MSLDHRRRAGCGALVLAALLLPARNVAASEPLDPAAAQRFATLALACVHKEYPNKIAHVLSGDADVQPPRSLTPAFYGCYDWHSAVHAHWLLARIARRFPGSETANAARAALAVSLTPENIGPELDYMRGQGRTSFERPYGLAWLLALAAELRSWNDPQARTWVAALSPLEAEAAARIASWLPKLHYPIRVGEHSQTAFAFGLIHDWARIAGNPSMLALLESRGRRLLPRRPRLPDRVRAVGRGFPLTLPGRGGFHAPHPHRPGIRAMAHGLPAAHPAHSERGLARPRRRHGSQRPEARAHRRSQPESRVDARRHRRGPAEGRSPGRRACGSGQRRMPRPRCRR